jgi:hypothetical protein
MVYGDVMPPVSEIRTVTDQGRSCE